MIAGIAATKAYLTEWVYEQGLTALHLLLREDAEEIAGPKGKHEKERTHNHWGSTNGELSFGGRRIQVSRPRVRSKSGEEASLPKRVGSRAVAGWRGGKAQLGLFRWVADYADPSNYMGFLPDGSVGKRARWTSESSPEAKELAELGHKAITETNDAKRTEMYEDVERRLAKIGPFVPLFQPAAPVAFNTKVKGITFHSVWSVDFYPVNLPKSRHAYVLQTMKEAYKCKSADKARKQLRALVSWLERNGYDEAAGSLREGMEETLTVLKLALPELLRRSLATTNAIENLNGTIRRVSRNVKRWKSPSMIRRWTALGVVTAEKKFRRIKGYRNMGALVHALKSKQKSLEQR